MKLHSVISSQYFGCALEETTMIAKNSEWLLKKSKGKPASERVLKTAATEAIYFIWKARNKILQGVGQGRIEQWRDICRNIAVRCENKPELNDVIHRADNKIR